MKTKLKQIFISFIVMIAFNIIFSLEIFDNLGIVSPHVGLLFVFGLLFGPYGALGATLGNVLMDLVGGYSPISIIPSAVFSFGISYLAYKLWYTKFRDNKLTKPRLDNIFHISLFLSSILICGFIYSAVHGNLFYVLFDFEGEFFAVAYFMNFINIAFIFGIISIWLSEKYDLTETPKASGKTANEKLYRILFYSTLILAVILFISLLYNIDLNIANCGLILLGILLFGYLTKPFEHEVEEAQKNTIIKNIMNVFLATTLFIAIIGMLLSLSGHEFVESIPHINRYLYLMPTLIITDAIIILFFIPGAAILKYIELKVIEPISSFSKIEKFIKEDEKIETEGLVNTYSRYVNEKNEIGNLARSYTELINHNNNYIENIHEIEGEKERIKAELDIATKIQAANLPTEAIVNADFAVDGYSHPAKEVGGDFFDYYMIDEDNLAIVIGDASGKGVPAAILAMITQVMIKQMVQHDSDPSRILYSLNNQLATNNPESMFITLWLGIYNLKSKRITFSNAGHNPPLIKENGEFKYMDINTGIVLGIMEDFDYVTEEIGLANELVLYTDGITDANNENNEMYGEKRLLEFFNGFKSGENPISPLLKDISDFTEDTEQYDDMTLLYLKDLT